MTIAAHRRPLTSVPRGRDLPSGAAACSPAPSNA